jgi:hypothetical protein
VGDQFGIFKVIDTSPLPDPHFGIRVKVRCTRCGFERINVLAQLRYKPPVTHRSCGKKAGVEEKRSCGIPASGGMIGYALCDLEWGHEGDIHGNAGDGFYARTHDVKHHRRQKERKKAVSGV